MKIIKPKIIISKDELDKSKLLAIESYARTCYKSEAKSGSSNVFLRSIINNGHESVIEHEKVTVIFVVDRGVSNQIIRHRIASYSQESTRYCNYSSDKFSNEITVISPCFYDINSGEYLIWKESCEASESAYLKLCQNSKAEEARSVLPNSLKTELVTTYNFREWRHFFKLRCSKKAHPQMRQVTIPLLLTFKKHFSVLFEDIDFDNDFLAKNYAKIILT